MAGRSSTRSFALSPSRCRPSPPRAPLGAVPQPAPAASSFRIRATRRPQLDALRASVASSSPICWSDAGPRLAATRWPPAPRSRLLRVLAWFLIPGSLSPSRSLPGRIAAPLRDSFVASSSAPGRPRPSLGFCPPKTGAGSSRNVPAFLCPGSGGVLPFLPQIRTRRCAFFIVKGAWAGGRADAGGGRAEGKKGPFHPNLNPLQVRKNLAFPRHALRARTAGCQVQGVEKERGSGWKGG